MTASGLSPVKAARFEKILDAAEALFRRDGFRATTMEGIAAAAGMSKVTVYGYCRDKDAVFVAVANRIAEDMSRAAEAAFSTDGRVEVRVGTALSAKHRVVAERVRSSPFASDLFTAKDRISKSRFADLDKDIERRIAAELTRGGRDPGKAAELARLLFAASQGIANAAADMDQAAADIAVLVTGVLRDSGR